MGIRIRLVGPIRTKSLEAAKAALWARLREKEREPFIPGSLRTMGPRAYSLAFRKGEKVLSWYVPARDHKTVHAMTESYREARGLLAKIANCELAILKARIEKRRMGEKNAPEGHRKRK